MKLKMMINNMLPVLLQNPLVTDKPSRDFYILFIASEIVITAIVFIGVYIIFNNFFKKKDAEESAKKKSNKSLD